ncbi:MULTISPECIES: 50S ribosomal protein L25/general stress protein Ctc [Bacillaceae]|uniref:Large ribosomal subunit protein bL25 n=2 Tax=Bacillus infantis TaxID=324767 RepID=U5L444_9BACI|nr:MULTISPECIES: 50S ribosomal protein L25/general stress protein Ctc [Bacillus]OXT15270.1 50S ribosomal protein L25/general stress protein Ctc [Bacillus sp. OG2]AGX02104.1 50S ribosomal protein L25 [Bacillus infantis NRRL B-14911]EAR63930.1 50S ribosomal protein L25 [Bacillus sp. NRRL B-14911]MCA1037761.1 50S ribosomal protein L25/general stress protein Ctc [Bacillus infantis]MCK6208599.1 50S ribosomal protein L25/general stress protein Ctc [Bacillus infantis]
MSTVLQAKERKEFRNSNLTQLRNEGNIPGVVYGNKIESKAIYLNGPDFIKTIRETGRNAVFSLDVEGTKHDVVLSDYQADPLKNEITHLDFRAVDMSQEITAEVRIELVGDAAGVKDGGVLQQPVHELSVSAKPNDIPQSVEVNIADLQVGESITAADIKAGRGFTINTDDETVIASILAPRQEEEISTGEEQEPGIPENQEGRETEANEE